MVAFLRVMELFVLGAIGYTLLQWQNYFVRIFGIVFVVFAQLRCMYVVHEMGHYSYSGNPKVDRIFQAITDGMYTFFLYELHVHNGSEENDCHKNLRSPTLSIPPLYLFVNAIPFDASENVLRYGWWESALAVGHTKVRDFISYAMLSKPSDQLPKQTSLDNNFDSLITDHKMG